ncbi:protein phosphatase 1 regulatory subunit 36-like [Trichoplusia ni]|uniref:Protein phosphatase 1 regulatory subunit 36-like n=1 Tax=Trichoplusia ni TaxID=7111 RepID=A0A7E5X1R7_TRINI|nr:protein phosphatase 1 regulatory subunit 36-like [Trichoplusia ni]
MSDDDDETGFGGLYEDGHWVWDDNVQALVFVSDLPPALIESVQITTKAPTGNIEFRDDVDLIEQLRYRRRYQRKLKPGEPDVVTLQDIKDIAIFTAPLNLLSPMLIHLLHLPTTERYLRALIFCMAYYIQIGDEMTARIMELESKIRTPDCEIVEREFRENLADLRLLVAKEYCVMLIGGGDLKKFHHKGPNKKRQSLSDKDARLFETFVRVSVQIVYLALGRRSFPIIELEVHRIIKSEIFNSVEHRLKSGYLGNMVPEERSVLLGPCWHQDKKLNTRSPLMNELFCHRPIDYRLMGVGSIKYKFLSSRLHYFHLVISAPEENLMTADMTVGIIGMPRALFDTMLRPIHQTPYEGPKSKVSVSSASRQSQGSKQSDSRRKSVQALQRYYPDIELPEKELQDIPLPMDFPDNPEPPRPVSEIQHRRWQNRYKRLTKPVAVR